MSGFDLISGTKLESQVVQRRCQDDEGIMNWQERERKRLCSHMTCRATQALGWTEENLQKTNRNSLLSSHNWKLILREYMSKMLTLLPAETSNLFSSFTHPNIKQKCTLSQRRRDSSVSLVTTEWTE